MSGTVRLAAPKRAAKLIRKLLSASRRLADFPESGCKPIELADDVGFREVVVEKPRLFYDYQPDANKVEIVAAFDARQNIELLFALRFGSASPPLGKA